MDPRSEMPRSPQLMSCHDSALLVVDAQTRLLEIIPNGARIVWNIHRLIDAADILGVAKGATEQYPNGLGPSDPTLSKKLGHIPDKLTFSCGGCPAIFERWADEGIHKILIVGIESHVCVQQSAFDLLADGFDIYLAVDATGSRFALDCETAIRRMDSAGVTITTTEAVLFEWCERAGTPQFKQISAIARRSPPE